MLNLKTSLTSKTALRIAIPTLNTLTTTAHTNARTPYRPHNNNKATVFGGYGVGVCGGFEGRVVTMMARDVVWCGGAFFECWLPCAVTAARPLDDE